MRYGAVTDYLKESKTRRRMHLTSFDPCCHDLSRMRETVLSAVEAGTDGFLLGGSTGVDGKMVDDFAGAIRDTLVEKFGDAKRPPLILFPSSAQTGVSQKADAVLFLSLLNSSDARYLIREQAMAALFLIPLGLEPVGCGMIVIEPGGTVGRIGKAELIAPDNITAAVGFAAAASAFGFTFIYVNAGSGSKQPVPPEMIRAISQAIDAPLIVGGGITDAQKASLAVQAGADIVVTGSAVESGEEIGPIVRALASAVHAQPPAESK